MLPYLLPFMLYIGLSILGGYFNYGPFILYPVKTIIVGFSLYYFRNTYVELKSKYTLHQLSVSIAVGILVFIVWILPEGRYPTLGTSSFDPFVLPQNWMIFGSIFFRILGASIIVPLFEELFWRSFLIRWIINQDFKTIAIGTFTWLSFGLTSLFFGLEHHRWLVGILAGIIYNLLLYKYKNIRLCVISHGVTNFILGIYVLITGQWSYW
ncbi:CAAX prenyl protease-related protein [candidate division KSB1 bacterium]|nr:CAAX prenyl protease-related protein [candidate division KSB1 bacterium]